MNPQFSPYYLVKSCIKNRGLIFNLVKRDVIGRYRGSIMGLFWSFFTPILMLGVYTFVFGVVFKSRWPEVSTGSVNFPIILFSGLLIYNFVAECLSKAPGIIIGNANYVKKVVFPLEILPVVTVLASLFHFFISFIVWLCFYLVVAGLPPITIVLLPLVIAPVVLMVVGLCWLLSASGVFLRDINQIIGVFISMLMFLSPVFYSISSLPPKYQTIMYFNPLTGTIGQMRDVMIWGKTGDWGLWYCQLVLSAVFAWICFVWFQKTRKGFADVL